MRVDQVRVVTSWVSHVVIGVVMMVAGISKVADASGLSQILLSMGLGGHWGGLVVILLVAVELAIGAACLLGRWSRFLTWAILSTLGALTLGMIVAYVWIDSSACGCFGAARGWFGEATFEVALARNLALMVVALLPTVVHGLVRQSGTQGSVRGSPTALLTLAFTGACFQDLAVQGQTTWHVAPWHMHLESRLETTLRPLHVDEIVRRVALSDDQATLLKALYQEHRTRMAVFRAEHEKSVAKAFEGVDVDRLVRTSNRDREAALAPLAESEPLLARIADDQAQLDADFLESARSVLREDQAGHWKSYLRWLNRQRWLRAGSGYPGDHLDPFAILEGMAIDEGDLIVPFDQFQQLLTQSEDDLDRALERRAVFAIRQARMTFRTALRQSRAGRPIHILNDDGDVIDVAFTDPEFAAIMLRDGAEWNRLIRDVHQMQESIRQRIAQSLSVERATEFRSRVRELASAHQPFRAEGYIEELLRPEELSDDRRAFLEELLTECRRRHRAFNDERYELLIRQAEIRFEADAPRSADHPRLLESYEIGDRLHRMTQEWAQVDDQFMLRAWGIFDAVEQSSMTPPPLWRKRN